MGAFYMVEYELPPGEVGGTTSVEVKFVDICRNADGEASPLDRY